MSTKDFSKKQENRLAKILGWSVVAGSGSRAFHPGDVTSCNWLCECKTHMSTGNRIVFYRDVWEKISEEAMSHHKRPVLFVDDGSQDPKNTWCMFPVHAVDGNIPRLPFPDELRGRSNVNLSFNNEEALTKLMEDSRNYANAMYYIASIGCKRAKLDFDLVGVTSFYKFHYMLGTYNVN